MKILHITSAKTWRGGERQIQYLMEGIRDLGHTNFLMSPRVSIISYRSQEIVAAQIEFKKGLFSRLRNMYVLYTFCKSNNIDLIHGHDSHAHTLLWLAYRFGRLQTKSIITRRLINSIKRRSITKYNHPKIERIICISNAVKTILSSAIKDQNRLAVIYSSIKITANPNKIKITKDNSNFVIGYVAAFTEEKDHLTFIAAAKSLISNYSNLTFRFMLIGDGPLIEKCKNQVKQISKNFEFTGFLEEVNQAYNDIDILLHTSKSEALGTAILDAMQYGIPIVATDIGGISEIVKDQENGILCDIGDYKGMAKAVYKIASDKERYTAFSIKSKEIASKFEITKMVNKTHDLYLEVVKERLN